MIEKNIIRKFTEIYDLSKYDLEIETDDGFVDVISLNKTIPYLKYDVITEDGLSIECANKHIVFNENFDEIFVDELKPGDVIKTIYGDSIVKAVHSTGKYEAMYDFELTNDSKHRYYTNGILSHNTLLVRTIARLLDVPLYIKDITACTSAGYVGEDVETCLNGLVGQAGGDIQRAEMGIIVFDEFDKIAKKDAGMSITRDVSGESVQQALLKIVEGDRVGIQMDQRRKHPEMGMDYIDTKNILFIAIGAFSGIENIVKSRMGNAQIGFATADKERIADEDLVNYVTAEDLKKYGFIPEIIGRFPVISHVTKLSEDDLVNILTEPKNSIIRQYQELLKLDNTNLVITDSALKEIASIAFKLKTGARALRTIVELILEDIMFDAAENREKDEITTITVDDEYVKKKADTVEKYIKVA